MINPLVTSTSLIKIFLGKLLTLAVLVTSATAVSAANLPTKPSQISELPIYAGMDTAQPIWAANGMVASVEALATDVGVDILKRGGNAVDAAVAVGFALTVTYPRAGNIGGGGFMVIHLAANESLGQPSKISTLDYREMAPSLAHKDLFLDGQGNVIKDKSLFHGASSGIPGSVKGMVLALEKYGSMSLAEVIQPAIDLAEQGIEVSYDLSRSLKAMKNRLQRWPSTKKIFYKENGEFYQPGEKLVQADLAKTFKIIAKLGSDGFYQGEVARKIVKSVNHAGGIFSEQDMANYKAVVREPVTTNYRGYQVYSMPPPSSGGVHLIQLLNILENSSLASMRHNTAKSVHQMAEAMKYVYADRSEYLGDPDYYKVPVNALISKDYAKSIYQRIDPNKTTPSQQIKPGDLQAYESDQTTHYSVIDQWGNAVSTTTTLNFSYGSGLVAEGTGVFMNNEMDDFSSKPGVPNAFGLLGGEANAIEPGKRPLSAMTPSIVMKDGEVFLLTGSPGGSRIITTTLQVILNVIDHQMNIAEATNSGRIHHQWFPDELRVERSLNADTIDLLIAKGHKVVMKSAMGSTQSIMKTKAGLFGASDPRSRNGKTAGH